jgi:hypothetical protein
MKRTIIFAVIALMLQATYCFSEYENSFSPDSVALRANASNASMMFYSGRKVTETVYMGAYFTIYKDMISGEGRFTSGELSDVIDYYMSNENLAKNMDSTGTRSNERISAIMKKAGANFGEGNYCYMTYSSKSDMCCVDATSKPDECFLNALCQGDKCIENRGSGCYMTSSARGEPCCVDYTVPYRSCYLESICDGDLCVDQPNPNPSPTPNTSPTPAPGCGAFICGDMVCDASMPYDPVFDEAVPSSACCCEEDCLIPCSSNSTTTTVATIISTTTIPLPTPAPDNSSCTITSSIYGEPCCMDATLSPGFCYLNSVCESGMCVDQQTTCYVTPSVYGGPCCVDATLPPGYCYSGSACQNGVCV